MYSNGREKDNITESNGGNAFNAGTKQLTKISTSAFDYVFLID